MKYGGVGSLNGLILEKGPDGSGRVYLINHATVPQRRSVTVVTTSRCFRCVCPNFILTEKLPGTMDAYDGPSQAQRSVDVSVSGCYGVVFCRISWCCAYEFKNLLVEKCYPYLKNDKNWVASQRAPDLMSRHDWGHLITQTSSRWYASITSLADSACPR